MWADCRRVSATGGSKMLTTRGKFLICRSIMHTTRIEWPVMNSCLDGYGMTTTTLKSAKARHQNKCILLAASVLLLSGNPSGLPVLAQGGPASAPAATDIDP